MKSLAILSSPSSPLRNSEIPLKIGIQKSGRLADQSIKFFQQNGIDIAYEKNGFYQSQNTNIQFYFLREKDIPKLIDAEKLDMGIIGDNTYSESNKGNLEYTLGFCKCRMVIAVPEESKILCKEDLQNATITTSYPNILKRYLQNIKVTDVTIDTYDGSIEMISNMLENDAIFDIVETGNSLHENNYRELLTVKKSEAVLITNNKLSLAMSEWQSSKVTQPYQLAL